MKRIICIIATRYSDDDFFLKSATGKSLKFYNFPFVDIVLYSKNTMGLPHLYNKTIKKYLDSDCIFLFIHDDVLLIDFHWARHLYSGLQYYDIVGVVGNKRRLSGQPSWAFINLEGKFDEQENFSGIIGHGDSFPPKSLDVYGTYGEVKLLDGVLIATTSENLKNHKLEFDEIFDFHFYDLDFCRTAEVKKMKIGTIPISMIHESGGGYSNQSWLSSYHTYLKKWGE
jgi:hypothetical protein